ncbi:MAG: hypothetical protein ABSC04_19230, partial [Syntrophobacteraceae bacterium]
PTARGWPLLTSGSRMCFKQVDLHGVGQFSTPKVGQFSTPIDKQAKSRLNVSLGKIEKTK